MNQLQDYFEKIECPYKITKHKMPGSRLELYIVKLDRRQYIHVYINSDNDFTASLHKLDMNTGEKIRISSDIRDTNIAEILDKMRPTFENPH